MSLPKPPLFGDATDEVSGLIEVLHQSAQRLEELTAGEVDTVADRDGRTFLLRPAQDHLRHQEAAKQAAILEALPAHVALLDTQGLILSVNRAWRQFAEANALPGKRWGIGVNYLDICDGARGDGAVDGQCVAAGIRSVLRDGLESFSMEYSCHSPSEQRWFLMTVTPLASYRPHGAVIMHVDISERKRGEQVLLRFTSAMEAMEDAIFMVDRASMRLIHVNDAACRLENRTRAELLAVEPWVALSTSRAELERTYDEIIASGVAARPLEMLRPRDDGSPAWGEVRRHAQRSANGWTMVSLVRDVTERKQAALELRESERRFSDLLQNVELLALTLDREARITFCNAHMLRVTGWREEEVIGRNLFDLFIPPEMDDLPAVFAALLDNQPAAWHHENEIFTRSGERRLIHWNNSVLRSAAGEVIGVAGVGQDITERKAAADRIAYLNRVYTMLSSINTLIVRVHDRDELYRGACRIACEAGAFRMSLICLVDRNTMKIAPVASAGKEEALMNTIRDRLSSFEGTADTLIARAIRTKKAVVSNDSRSDQSLVFGLQYAEAGVRSLAVLPLMVANDAVGVLALYACENEFFHEEELKLLTELAGDIAFAIDHLDKRERLDYLAYYDVLTGLANRRLFLERVTLYLRGAVSSGCQLALFLIDLERFKSINDSLGQSAGDALLGQVAEWLTHRTGDINLLARVGADHFAVVLPEVNPEGDVARLLDKVMTEFRDHPFRLDDAVFRIAFKGGVALFPNDGADAETLFRNAEAALKKAKAGGERYLFYTQAMTATVASQLSLENQLRQALEKREFVLHYQPKVNLVSGKVAGAEALIRWNDPRTGLVPPGRFIPVLEQTGLIHEVGRWALRQAVEDYRRWRADGLAVVRIAVNVSPLQLRSRDFIAEIAQAIGSDAQAAAGLELEITESLIMADIKHSIASLQAIRGMGVSIAIDDFGTGFSSLSYLAKLPVDTLKIDRSFVIDMTAAPEGLALVSTIINLAHALKLRVVAEGVETDEQSHLLRLLNCDEMQGFLFSRAVPGEIFETKYLAPPAAG
jgi:diguanylate cyclase (GGDEF)-like protein/PAS domain S-box-containing protein